MRYLKRYEKVIERRRYIDPVDMTGMNIPNDIAYELKDDGYTVSYQWFPLDSQLPMAKHNKYPHINIVKRIHTEQGGLEKISYAWIKDFCERVSSYLDERGYNSVVKFRKLNTNDYYDINKSYPFQTPFNDHQMATSIHFKIEMIDRNIYGDVYESVNTSFDWLRKQNNERYIDLMYILQSDIFDDFNIVSKTDEDFNGEDYPEHKFWMFRMKESATSGNLAFDTSSPGEIGDRTIDSIIVYNISKSERDSFYNEVLELKEKVKDLIGKELVISEEIIDDGYTYDYIIKLVG